VVPVAIHRGWTKSPLLDQVVEEAGGDIAERLTMVGPARRLEAGHHNRQHLLDRAADLLRHRSRRAGCMVGCDTLVNERLDMCRQIADGMRTAPAGELAEGEPDRHAAPDTLRAVPAACHPGDVRLDLRRDIRPPKAIDRRRLEEILLQHGQPPFYG
jgi:hypothetical protein